MLEKSGEYYDYQVMVQLGLFIYFILIVLFGVSYIWWLFVKHLVSMLFKSRYMLGILSLDSILANPYVSAILDKEKKT